MEMEEKYGMMDLSHYMNGRPIFPSMPQSQPQTPRDLHYAMVMLGGGPGGGGMSFGSDSTIGMASATSGLSADSGGGGAGGNGLDMEIGGYGGRWTREETLTLLEIRSGLDSIFRKANHKGPLWDEVSRIMSVEHGYRRTGKKCSEKFENLYKYYKKIKGGKAGRQDKKHYRFFSQLEAIYGETSASTNHDDPNPLSVSNIPHLPNNPSMFDPSSCDFANHYAPLPPFKEDTNCVERTSNKRSLGKKYWKTMITDFIEKKTQTLIEKQDAWMEKMMKTIDEKEKERILKEKQWRKETAARLEMEKKFRANERACMESRDSALMEALHKLTANKSTIKTSTPEYCNDQDYNVTSWGENEITQLIQLRTNMETRFEQGGCMEEVLWEEIALTMACLGYNRNALICKAKWDHINFQLRANKRKENTRCSDLYSHHNYNFHQLAGERSGVQNDSQNDGGYRVLMNDPEIIGNYYGNKIGKGENY